MPQALYYTAAMVRALPDDGQRYETVHGELLVTPAPRWPHQRVLARLLRALADYVEAEGLGEVVTSPADLSWGDDTLVQPDLFVVPAAQVSDRWESIHLPALVIEILSPSTARADRFAKRRLYQEVGIPAYWIVDLDRGQVEVWTPELHFPQVESDELRWHPAGAARPFVLPLRILFPVG